MRLIRSVTYVGGTRAAIGFLVAVSQVIGGGLVRAESKPAKPDPVAVGYEIFNREWMPNDPRAHGGDGLGPVYNDTSCVACHNSGGSGGAGPASKNIDILNAALNPAPTADSTVSAQSERAAEASAGPTAAPEDLVQVHPAFRLHRTAVLHRFGIDPNYQAWRSNAFRPAAPSASIDISQRNEDLRAALLTQVETLLAKNGGPGAERVERLRACILAGIPTITRAAVQVGPFLVSRSQRNPTALFGLGLIDAIPEEAIEAMAKRQAEASPRTAGRVSRLKDGRIGRLGWKGQTANAEDFVLNVCAVELGLEVPGHHQAIVPQAPKYQTPGLDLTAQECASLTAYVHSLPRPVVRPASGSVEAQVLAAGNGTFAKVGCADCHAPKVGKVEGIYSDLLLHDLGPELAGDGSYSDGSSESEDEPLVPSNGRDVAANQPVRRLAPEAPRAASRSEWRTPPLWGLRDSGPYLHDGRALTLEQAVALHGGQAAVAAAKFFDLSPRERLQIEAFLKSLIAPPSIALAQRAE